MDVVERALVEGQQVTWFSPQSVTHFLCNLGEVTQPF